MALLGGSPLGLIGLKSVPTNGMSGFNQGPSNNVLVANYNRSQSANGKAALSLFGGKRRLRAWPNISASVTKPTSDKSDQRQDTTGLSDVYVSGDKLVDNFKSSIETDKSGNTIRGSNLLHNNDVYDTSVLNILEKLSGTKAELKATDFAYLKYLGVYPNNRLMIARRFVAPSGDNIMVKKSKADIGSIATLISWKPEGDDFLEITFGEEWTAAKADFTGILNSLGDDYAKTGVGKIAGAAGNVLPLPGFTEIFQRKFLEKLELLESGAGNQIPAGNPNLIKEAKVRKTVPYGEASSGLKAKVSIKMACEYELKFISGIDPTIVWMDLIGTIVRFGTSESSNYGLSQKVAAKLGRWAADPYKLISDVITGIKEALKYAKDELITGLKNTWTEATIAANEIIDDTKSAKDVAMEAADAALAAGTKLANALANVAITAIRSSVMKYRVEVMGIVSALTGNPSTPWHITLGNPLRPIFCSGDMLVEDVTLKLGPTLAFNDLPSSIIAEFTIANARNLGMQEIMSKFNSGYLRTVDVQKTFFETNILFGANGSIKQEEFGKLTGESKTSEVQSEVKPPDNTNQGGGNTPTGTQSGGTQSGGTQSGGTQSGGTQSGGTQNNGTSNTGGTPSNTGGALSPGSQIGGNTASNTGNDQTKMTGGQK